MAYNNYKNFRVKGGDKIWAVKKLDNNNYKGPTGATATDTDSVWEDVKWIPEQCEENEWLAQKTCELFKHTTVVYDTICSEDTPNKQSCCTKTTCPVMSGGPKYQYYWSDENGKQPVAVSAPEYVSLLKQWIQRMLADEKIFPTAEGSNFPANFKDIISQIFRRLLRVYVHLYYSHFAVISAKGQEQFVNEQFTHFCAFILNFNLVSANDRKPVQELIDNLFKNDSVYQTKYKASSSSSAGPTMVSSASVGADKHNSSNGNNSNSNDCSSDNRSSNTVVPVKKSLKLLVELDFTNKRVDIEGVSNMTELTQEIKKRFNVTAKTDLLIEYYDEEFDDFVMLEDLHQLVNDKGRLRLRKPQPSSMRYRPSQPMWGPAPDHTGTNTSGSGSGREGSTLPRNFGTPRQNSRPSLSTVFGAPASPSSSPSPSASPASPTLNNSSGAMGSPRTVRRQGSSNSLSRSGNLSRSFSSSNLRNSPKQQQ